jgi:hypothetical protein
MQDSSFLNNTINNTTDYNSSYTGTSLCENRNDEISVSILLN